MPDWWPQLCLLVFLTHLPFFAWRFARTGEVRFAATSLTFVLLSLAYGLRVFTPELQLGDRPAWQLARIPAWAAAVVSIGLLLCHHRLGRPAAGPQHRPG